MTLGLIRGLVALAEHDDTWRDEFLAECKLIAAALQGLGCQIEHVGSTAVPGMAAKPILDIALGCPPQIELLSVKAPLEALGWIYRGDAGDAGGQLFVKGESVRTHHLHVVALHGEKWTEYLAFRDLLRSDPESRALYATAKRTLAREFNEDRKSYTDGKATTVQQLLLKAGCRRGNR